MINVEWKNYIFHKQDTLRTTRIKKPQNISHHLHFYIIDNNKLYCQIKKFNSISNLQDPELGNFAHGMGFLRIFEAIYLFIGRKNY